MGMLNNQMLSEICLAYFWGLNFREYPQKIWPEIWYSSSVYDEIMEYGWNQRYIGEIWMNYGLNIEILMNYGLNPNLSVRIWPFAWWFFWCVKIFGTWGSALVVPPGVPQQHHQLHHQSGRWTVTRKMSVCLGRGRKGGRFFSSNYQIPSGKRLHSNGKIHYVQWENPLFPWPFSIAMLVITRG